MFRRLFFALVLVTIAAQAQAASHNVVFSAAREARADKARLAANTATCQKLSLIATCTDAQAKAKDSSVTIYADVDSYLAAFFNDTDTAWTTQQSAADADAAKTTCKQAPQSDRDAACVALKLSAGCNLCP